MSASVRIVAAVCVLLLLAMVAIFVVSAREMGLIAGLRSVAGTWWGVTTLVDLGVGLAFVAGWMWMLERRSWARPLWVIAVFLLGNFTTLVFLLLRCRRARSVREIVLGG